jgi:acid stress-induced BolA-like protein IbaG/YrbA
MEEEVRKALLAQGFTPDQIYLEQTQSGNVGGFVVSPRFAGHSQVSRQETLWSELRKHLTPEHLQRIVSILTMTPDEIDDDVRSTGT